MWQLEQAEKNRQKKEQSKLAIKGNASRILDYKRLQNKQDREERNKLIEMATKEKLQALAMTQEKSAKIKDFKQAHRERLA